MGMRQCTTPPLDNLLSGSSGGLLLQSQITDIAYDYFTSFELTLRVVYLLGLLQR